MVKYTFTYLTKPLSYYKTIRKSKRGDIYLTPEGKIFRKFIKSETKRFMNECSCQRFDEDIDLNIKFYYDNRRKNDLDNSMKTIGDALNTILYKDDCLIKRLCLEKLYDKVNPRIIITIKLYKEYIECL